MSLVASAVGAAERAPLPDVITRIGIGMLVGRTRRSLAGTPPGHEDEFLGAVGARSIAEHADAANQQHYELPPEFFALTLGPRRKYSCCLYPRGDETLAEAEVAALEQTVAHADLHDGQRVLELGCGWGSLTLFMAARFPASTIVAVSNSTPQRLYIEGRARELGLDNVTVVTADMNAFSAPGRFDRIVSVEMFEHMSNWRMLLAKVSAWLEPDGRLFIHVFTHRARSYLFDHGNKADWIARHFFTGGIMPSRGLIHRFPDIARVEKEWHWNGRHYQRTAEHWLANFDANVEQVDRILSGVYGRDARLWRRRWRLFYLATAGLFGHAGGDEWGVSHYLLDRAGR